jgi:uncharacterized protein YyaL (SSP411 family)
MRRNRLQTETSPYLLQHAGHPVDWFPWGDEAFAKALAEDKPVLLSVGYSACHWCHVMAHESFADPAVAAVMNARFVNVKVDREERPDVDRAYQLALQLLTRSPGGWPLTMFLAPEDRRPFFGGTYFPREPGRGAPGILDLLDRVADYFAMNRAQIRAQRGVLDAAIAAVQPAGGPPDADLDAAPIDAARAALAEAFDPDYGGFGTAPKFPHPAMIERALRHWRATSPSDAPDLHALFMAALSLTRIAEGGIRDAIGSGFHRYSVDRAWRIPHFEKMLYDNAALLALYAQAYAATGEALYAQVAAETAEWALREMRAPGGGFYSSLDADSDGREGAYYLWDREEVAAALEPADYAAFAARFGLDREPNVDGRWHLVASESVPRIAERLGHREAEVEAALARACRALAAQRTRRARPARDEKVLTAWNALMIKGLALAARTLGRPDLAQAATAAADFLEDRLWVDGRLHAVHAGGRTRFAATLDDHAFLADALFELLQTRWRTRDYDRLIGLAEILLERFEDAPNGGFFFTAAGEEAPLGRLKSFGDDATPAGNAIAAETLLRIGYLAGEPRYLRAARRALAAAMPSMRAHPAAHMGLVNALQCERRVPTTVVIRGSDEEAERWARELHRGYAPERSVFRIPADEPALPAALADKRADHATLAYRCVGTTCFAPVRDFGALLTALGVQNAPADPGNSTGLANPSADTDEIPKK